MSIRSEIRTPRKEKLCGERECGKERDISAFLARIMNCEISRERSHHFSLSLSFSLTPIDVGYNNLPLSLACCIHCAESRRRDAAEIEGGEEGLKKTRNRI